MKKKTYFFSTKILIVIGVLLIIALLGCGSIVVRQLPHDQVACTEEAKQCPDGTYVGRQGPRCEFAPCPVHH